MKTLLLSILAFSLIMPLQIQQQGNPNPVVIVTLDGKPYQGAHVVFTSRDQFVQNVTSDSQGRAQLTNALLGGTTPIEYNCTLPAGGIGAVNNPVSPPYFFNSTLVINPYTVFYCKFSTAPLGGASNAALLTSGIFGSALSLSLAIIYGVRIQRKRVKRKGGRYG